MTLWDPAYVAVRPGASVEIMVIAEIRPGYGSSPTVRRRRPAGSDPAVRPTARRLSALSLSRRAGGACRCRPAQAAHACEHAASRCRSRVEAAAPGEMTLQASCATRPAWSCAARRRTLPVKVTIDVLPPKAEAIALRRDTAAHQARPRPGAAEVYSPPEAGHPPHRNSTRTLPCAPGTCTRTVPLRSGVTLCSWKQRCSPELDYLDVEGIDELKSVTRTSRASSSIRAGGCWSLLTGVGRNFRKSSRMPCRRCAGTPIRPPKCS